MDYELTMNYLRLTKLTTERRLRQFRAEGGRNGGSEHSSEREDPLTKAVRKSTEGMLTAYDRLLKSLDEAVGEE